MAIDTREKRQSVCTFGSVWLMPAVTPNASKDQEWRQEALWSYSGIASDSPSTSILVESAISISIRLSLG